MKTSFTHSRSARLNNFITLLAFVLILLISYACAARKKAMTTIDGEEPFVVVEEMPMFPGGDSALLAYVAANTHYPESARAKGIQGRVIARFCVTKLGTIDLVSILKGVNADLDVEAIRVVKSIPKFSPGKQGGKPVSVWYMIPVEFSLDKEKK